MLIFLVDERLSRGRVSLNNLMITLPSSKSTILGTVVALTGLMSLLHGIVRLEIGARRRCCTFESARASRHEFSASIELLSRARKMRAPEYPHSGLEVCSSPWCTPHKKTTDFAFIGR